MVAYIVNNTNELVHFKMVNCMLCELHLILERGGKRLIQTKERASLKTTRQEEAWTFVEQEMGSE